MVDDKNERLNRDDWLRASLDLCTSGIEQVKIAARAADMGVTSGSFYWHFKNRRELLEALLGYWEHEMTDVAMDTARRFPGTAQERIYRLMEGVMTNSFARYDLTIWLWAQSDAEVAKVFQRVLTKRFEFAAWMFAQVGFQPEQAEARGRMMVVYLMGESTLVPDSMTRRKQDLRIKHAILIAPEV